jgi:hypothetical protein
MQMDAVVRDFPQGKSSSIEFALSKPYICVQLVKSMFTLILWHTGLKRGDKFRILFNISNVSIQQQMKTINNTICKPIQTYSQLKITNMSLYGVFCFGYSLQNSNLKQGKLVFV